jgi:hypothetical protein
MVKGVVPNAPFKTRNQTRIIFLIWFFLFWTFFLKQAVLFRLLQKIMGDGNQPKFNVHFGQPLQ